MLNFIRNHNPRQKASKHEVIVFESVLKMISHFDKPNTMEVSEDVDGVRFKWDLLIKVMKDGELEEWVECGIYTSSTIVTDLDKDIDFIVKSDSMTAINIVRKYLGYKHDIPL